MKKVKRTLTMCLACVLLVSAIAIPASAVNNVDTNFTIPATSTSMISKSTELAQRQKQDSSSSYINYDTRSSGIAATGPYQFEAFIYGANTRNGVYIDCSSYTYNGLPRTKCIVTRGTVGLVRQDIWEIFYNGDGVYPYGQIYGRRSGDSGYARGCWSVDSVGSYDYYNDLL